MYVPLFVCSGAQPTWEENWKNSDNFTTLIVCTLRSKAIHPQKSPAKPASAVPPSTNSGGKLIAIGFSNYPLPLNNNSPYTGRFDDIPLLAAHFITLVCLRLNRPEPNLTQGNLKQL